MPRPRRSFKTTIVGSLCHSGLVLAFGAVLAHAKGLHAQNPVSCCKNCPACNTAGSATRTVGPWVLESTENFCVCCPQGTDPGAIARSCESLRDQLTCKWLGEAEARRPWSAHCYVVFHPSEASYLREVGAGGKNTLGSSLTKTANRRVVSRRIDVRGDIAEPLRAALPHELTHVILADAFAGEELPRWADEGMAMQADPTDKLAGHHRDLDWAIAAQTVFHVGELFTKAEYPTADARLIFYGESASLVNYLTARRSPADFVRFVHMADRRGYEAALADVYGIAGVAALEHLWRSQVDLALKQPQHFKPQGASEPLKTDRTASGI